MRLNPDCVRAILLAVEEATDVETGLYYTAGPDEDDENAPTVLAGYTDNEIRYHINQCDLAGFFTDCNQYVNGNCLIMDLSPIGHEFLANIREESNWEKVKNISTKAGSKSLKAMSQIATAVIEGLIKSQLGLP